MTDIDTAKLREIASAATQGEWRYRPLRFDDWGWVRSSDGETVAIGRGMSCQNLDVHRAEGTDPYGPNAIHIATFDPPSVLAMCDEIDRLRALLRRASEALDPFVDVLGEDEPIGDEVKVKTAWGPCVDYTLTVGDLRAACTVAREIEEAVGDA